GRKAVRNAGTHGAAMDKSGNGERSVAVARAATTAAVPRMSRVGDRVDLLFSAPSEPHGRPNRGASTIFRAVVAGPRRRGAGRPGAGHGRLTKISKFVANLRKKRGQRGTGFSIAFASLARRTARQQSPTKDKGRVMKFLIKAAFWLS